MAQLQCPRCGSPKIRSQRNITSGIIYGSAMIILGTWSLSRPGSQIMGVLAIGLGLVVMVVFFSPFHNIMRCRSCGFRWDLRNSPAPTPTHPKPATKGDDKPRQRKKG
jgi:hypothetical protein